MNEKRYRNVLVCVDDAVLRVLQEPMGLDEAIVTTRCFYPTMSNAEIVEAILRLKKFGQIHETEGVLVAAYAPTVEEMEDDTETKKYLVH